jgi:phospholipase C
VSAKRVTSGFVAVFALVVVLGGCGSTSPKANPAGQTSTTGSKSTGSSATSSPPSSGGPSSTTVSFKLGDIKHVFVIVLENESYSSTFGVSADDPYLASTLVSEGALLRNFYAVGHDSLDNYIAMISGQPPTTDTQDDCARFVGITGSLGPGGIETGNGCVYPPDVETVASQLTSAGLTWKAYMQDMGNVPSRESAACGHPTIGSPDQTEIAVPGDGYATRHDPFMYFSSIIDDPQTCDSHVVALGSPSGQMPASAQPHETGLADDLRSVATTPDFSFITPNLCDDGHDFPCINQASGASAYADYDSFLQTWVPIITSSAAFKSNGMLLVTFDEAETGAQADAACCGERPGPAAAQPGRNGPGGGIVGAVVISPFVRPGTVSSTSYNDFSFLATVEQIFGLGRLGEAATATSTFGPDVFDRPT